MAKKYQNKYRIDSARMKNYDYSSNGAYFLTILTNNRDHFFGDIVDGNMVLNEIGAIARKYWIEITQHFPFVRLDEMVVMPNHIHGILWIDDNLVCSDGDVVGGGDGDVVGGRDAINRVSTEKTEKTEKTGKLKKTNKTGGITGNHNPMFHNNISRVIRWYKGRCTFEINRLDINKLTKNTQLFALLPFAWQARFHDRIIRNENELNRIRNYIIKNPEIWERDRNNGNLWL